MNSTTFFHKFRILEPTVTTNMRSFLSKRRSHNAAVYTVPVENRFFSILASDFNFPKCGVYDDGCHLVEFIRNHYSHDMAQTPASTMLYETRFSVDRTHFKGHVGRWCRANMNPNKNKSIWSMSSISATYFYSFSAGWNQHTGCWATFFVAEGLRTHSEQSGVAKNAHLPFIVISLQKSCSCKRSSDV